MELISALRFSMIPQSISPYNRLIYRQKEPTLPDMSIGKISPLQGISLKQNRDFPPKNSAFYPFLNGKVTGSFTVFNSPIANNCTNHLCMKTQSLQTTTERNSLLTYIQQHWLSTPGAPKQTLKRKQQGAAIGRISSPVNPSSSIQSYQPTKMTVAQRDALNQPTNGMIIYNTNDQQYQLFDGNQWNIVAHYPGERMLGGIVVTIYEQGVHGLLTSISHQITTVHFTEPIEKQPYTPAIAKSPYPMQRFPLQIIKGSHNSYATRMAAHYCVSAGGELIKDWRIPTLAELITILQDSMLGASFKSGSAWGFTNQDSINWLLIEDAQNKNVQPENFYIRLVRDF